MYVEIAKKGCPHAFFFISYTFSLVSYLQKETYLNFSVLHKLDFNLHLGGAQLNDSASG